MALTAFEILGVLKLDTSGFQSDLSRAEGAAGGLGRGLGSALKLGAAAVAGATTAAVGFGKSSIDAATSFESAFTGVRKTVDGTEEEFGELSKWIMDASTKMASSKESIAGTMEIAGQLGISGVEALEKFTSTMVMLGDTTNLSSEDAAGALARFMNITGDSAENADKIGSVIVDLGNHFATTESDIVAMSTRLASAGTIAGLSANDILALSTSMSSVGIQAEAGGTAMAQTLAKMSKAVDQGGETLDTFAQVAGMSSEDFAKTWKNKPIDAIQAFIAGLGRVNEADESVIMTLEDLGLKGIRQTNMLQALALSSEMLGSAVDMANSAYEDNIALTNEASLRYGTTESQAMQTAESFKNLKVVLGQELMPVYGEVMQFSKKAMDAMSKGFEEGGLDGLISSLGTALSDAIGALVQNAPKMIDLGLDLLGALADGLIAKAPEIFDSLIQIADIIIDRLTGVLGKAAEKLSQVDWSELVRNIGDFIKDSVSGENAQNLMSVGIDIISEIISGISESLPDIIEEGAEIVVAFVDSFTKVMKEKFPEMAGVFDGLNETISTVFGWIADNGETVVKILGAILAGIVAFKVVTGIINAIAAAQAILNAVLMINPIFLIIAAIAAIVAALVMWWNSDEEFRNKVTAAWEKIKEFFTGLWEGIKGVFSGIGEWFGEKFTKAKEAATGAWDNFKDNMSEKWELTKKVFELTADWFGEKFGQAKDAAAGAWDDFKDKMSTRWENTKLIFSKTVEWFSDKFGKAKDASAKRWDDFKDKMSTRWENTKAVFSTVGSWFEGKFQKAKDNVVNVWSNIKEKFTTVWENIKSAFDFSKALEWGRDLISNFINGIKNGWNDLKGALGKLADKIADYIGFSEPKEGPLSNFHTFAPDMIDLFTQGIADNTDELQNQIAKSFDFSDLIGGDISANLTATPAGAYNNSVTINVYGAEGQDVNELAEIISRRIAYETKKQSAAWGMA